MTLLSTKEVAEYYGKTDREVRYAIQSGKLEPIKVGHGLVFDKDKLPSKWVVRPKKPRGNK